MPPTSTYHFWKKILLCLVVFSYLAGTFHEVVFELAHAVSHQFSGNHFYHSHHLENQNDEHEHLILDISKTAVEEHADTSIPNENSVNFSFDKLPQICSATSFLADISTIKNRNIFSFNLQILPSPYLQNLFPPPEFGWFILV